MRALGFFIEIKRPSAAVLHPHRLIGKRLYAALRMISSITTHELGLALSEPLLRWIAKHVDPQTLILSSLIWVATNLATQRADYFLPRAAYVPRPTFVRPRSELPAALLAFTEQRQLDTTFAIGERDALIGFTPY